MFLETERRGEAMIVNVTSVSHQCVNRTDIDDQHSRCIFYDRMRSGDYFRIKAGIYIYWMVVRSARTIWTLDSGLFLAWAARLVYHWLIMIIHARFGVEFEHHVASRPWLGLGFGLFKRTCQPMLNGTQILFKTKHKLSFIVLCGMVAIRT